MKVRIVIPALLFILLFTFTARTLHIRYSPALDFPTRAVLTTDKEITVDIPSGATGLAIGKLLFDSQVVKSSTAYFQLAVSDKRSEKVAPGSHRLTLKIPVTLALDQLLDPTRIPNLIKITEGAWKSDIAAALERYGFSKLQVSAAFDHVTLPTGFTQVEGLLFPAQYSFAKGASATQVVAEMIGRFQIDPNAKEILNYKGAYSPEEILTIASIVQAEADAKDFPKVARVIFNRLKISMPLQMDSTVHYIKKVRGQIFLSTTSTLMKSPYNTYQRYGLPPSPIGNPGTLAMVAALHPAIGDWLYFITLAPGDTRFTRSHDQFLLWKVIYEKNRRAGLFK